MQSNLALQRSRLILSLVPNWTKKKQKCQWEKPDQEDSIQGSVGRLESGKTSVKENEGKKRSRPSDPSSKEDILKTLVFN